MSCLPNSLENLSKLLYYYCTIGTDSVHHVCVCVCVCEVIFNTPHHHYHILLLILISFMSRKHIFFAWVLLEIKNT